MHPIKLLPLFILYTIGLHAQSTLDSLWNIWEDTSKPDTLRSIALEDYIYEDYFYSNPDSAIILAKQLHQFNETIEYKLGMVHSLDLLGYISFRTGHYTEAFEYYENGLTVAKEIDYSSGIAGILVKIGIIHHDNGDLLKALNYYQDALKLYEAENDHWGMSSIYNEFGSIYREQEDYDLSLSYYLKAMSIYEESDSEDNKATIFLNIGNAYLNQKDFDKALENYKKGLAIDEKKDDKIGIASGLSGIGNVHIEQGNYKNALAYLQKSLKISEQIENIQGTAHTLLSIGYIYEHQKQYGKSINSYQKALKLAQNLGDLGTQMDAHDNLYNSYKSMGQAKIALKHLEQMLIFSDSLETATTAKTLQQMEFSKQLLADSLVQVQKDIKVEMAHQTEIQRRDKIKNMALGTGLLFLLLAGGFFNRWQYVKKSKALLQKEKNRSESLLLNILPYEVAEELKEKGASTARDYELVSILFTDFKGYTEKSENLSAQELVGEIDHCFKAFDHICEKYSIEKIKTIGDAYMAAGGLPVPAEDAVENTVLAALEMQNFIKSRILEQQINNKISFEMRIGIHTGPVVAGIVGIKKFQYDVWGDTVNTASRMENKGVAGKVNISQQTYELLQSNPLFSFEPRGKINVKGKGDIEMWFVEKKPSNV